jgi:hypothetical protein
MLIGKRGNDAKIMSQLLEANVDFITLETANNEGIKFNKIDYSSRKANRPSMRDVEKKKEDTNQVDFDYSDDNE